MLKDLNDLLQNQDEKTRRAQALLKEESRAKLNYQAALSEEEKAAVQRAKAFLKENYTPRIIKLLERGLRAEEHLYPKDINRMIAHTAGMITNFNNTLKMQLDGFIRWAETAQRENYNRYIWRKLDGLIGRRQFEKSGNVKKAKYGQTAIAFLKAAKEIWDLTPQNAEIKLQAQKNKSFENFEKNEAADIKDVLLNRVLEFKIKGKDNNPQASRRTLDEVQALRLNKIARAGGLADTRQAAARFFGGGEQTVAGAQLQGIMQNELVGQLKKIFGGQISEGERAYLDKLYAADLSMSEGEREALIRNVYQAALNRVKSKRAAFEAIFPRQVAVDQAAFEQYNKNTDCNYDHRTIKRKYRKNGRAKCAHGRYRRLNKSNSFVLPNWLEHLIFCLL